MPNLLVTGRWGETHVTSAQARNFHAGVFGSGQYVLSGLTATMTTANTCHIDPGVACFNGADVEVPAGGVDVTIDNGTQGQKRNDLVVLRYSSEPSTQTESVELAVVKGTPASSDPQDPAHNEGSILEGDSPCDMPLYRIPLDGITVGDPVLLAPAWMAPNRAVVSSADGTPTASAVTATELGYLDGVTSGVQGQIDALGDSLSQLPSRVIVGVGVWSANAESEKLTLWTKEQFAEQFGVAFSDNFDCAAAMNGDVNAQETAKVLGCWYQSGDVGVFLSGHSTGPIRINYALFMH